MVTFKPSGDVMDFYQKIQNLLTEHKQNSALIVCKFIIFDLECF